MTGMTKEQNERRRQQNLAASGQRTRDTLVKKVVSFAIAICKKRGQESRRPRDVLSTCVARELLEFGGFSFYVALGQSIVGGNSAKIYFHYPQQQGAEPRKLRLVLSLYWQFSIGDCGVKVFDEDLDWQQAIKRAIQHETTIANLIDDKAANERDEKAQEIQQAAAQSAELSALIGDTGSK